MPSQPADSPVLEAALDRARSQGASHADVRITSTRHSAMSVRDGDLQACVDQQGRGLGVRVVVDGCWGFASSDVITQDEARAVAERAVAMARMSRHLTTRRVELAPEPVHVGTWESPYDIDPFEVSQAERLAVITERSLALRADRRVDHVDASLLAVREGVEYADSHGSHTEQVRRRIEAQWSVTAIEGRTGAFESMTTTAPPAARGWEYVLGAGEQVGGARPWDWDAELSRLPELVQEKLTAPGIEPGRYTLVLDPTNLWLTIHESVGHATELDRALGYEANYAGTSFATPDLLGTLRYGSPLMHVTGDRTAPYGLSSVAWDDEGVAAQAWDLVRDGILVGYQLDRAMAAELGLGRSNGCAYADAAEHVPIQRMPNVSLQPDPSGGSVDDLIAGVEDGLYIVGDNSWSIDMQRYNFQFTGQQFHRIRNGRLVGQVKDVAYQSSTPQFWGSLIALGGPSTYLLGGALNCGKGQPGQVAAVSHGCPAAVFADVNVLNSAQEGG
ncbi:MAG: TldD/PmbA family protein [Actinomycetales bacterium]|nr:TldD/PmbA family protein [Actinomycetales bacterium]